MELTAGIDQEEFSSKTAQLSRHSLAVRKIISSPKENPAITERDNGIYYLLGAKESRTSIDDASPITRSSI